MKSFPKPDSNSALPLFIEGVPEGGGSSWKQGGYIITNSSGTPCQVSLQGSLELALARHTTSKLSVCPRLLASFLYKQRRC